MSADVAAFPIEEGRGAITVVNVVSGERTTIESNEVVAPVNELDPFVAVSPDRDMIAYSVNRGFAGSHTFQQLFDLVVAPADDLADKRVVGRRVPQWFGGDLSWSPDGRYLAWYQSGPGERGDVYVHDTWTATTRLLTPGQHANFAPLISLSVSAPVWLDRQTIIARAFDGPPNTHYEDARSNSLWTIGVSRGPVRQLTKVHDGEIFGIVTKAPTRVAVRSGNGVVVAIKSSDQKELLYTADLTTGRLQFLAGGAHSIGYATGWDSPIGSPDGHWILYVRQAADEPPDVWVIPARGGTPRRITDLNPNLSRNRLAKATLLSYPGPNGGTLRSALLMPPGWSHRRPVPMIVYPYGGALRSELLNNFGLTRVPAGGVDNLQVFTTRGFGVLLPDAPVRTGKPMADIARTVLASVDEAIRLGYADSTRLGLMGHSYGAYTVYALIAQSRRFSAAIAVSGFSDWVTLYSGLQNDGSSHGITQAETRQYGLGASPWDAKQLYLANSPFYRFDRVTTPTLILHGTADVIDDFNARMSFVALRRLSKDVALVLYGDEHHSPSSWSSSNQKDYLERITQWFDHYLCRNGSDGGQGKP